jgi:hypothetical protein
MITITANVGTEGANENFRFGNFKAYMQYEEVMSPEL